VWVFGRVKRGLDVDESADEEEMQLLVLLSSKGGGMRLLSQTRGSDSLA
jgi:hypothetical protein